MISFEQRNQFERVLQTQCSVICVKAVESGNNDTLRTHFRQNLCLREPLKTRMLIIIVCLLSVLIFIESWHCASHRTEYGLKNISLLSGCVILGGERIRLMSGATST